MAQFPVSALLRHLPDAFEKLFGKATEVPRNFGGLTHLSIFQIFLASVTKEAGTDETKS